jgi:hypothetical protein
MGTNKLKYYTVKVLGQLEQPRQHKIFRIHSPTVSTVGRGHLSFSLSGFQAAEETKKIIPGRAAETISIIHFNDVYNVESREVSLIKLNMKTTIRKSSFLVRGILPSVVYPGFTFQAVPNPDSDRFRIRILP